VLRDRSQQTPSASAASRPAAARAQQPAKLPTVGVLHPSSLEALAERLGGFRQGLKDIGYVEGENVAIEYRYADKSELIA
jgi:putative ABC transport system substrate-binding protein